MASGHISRGIGTVVGRNLGVFPHPLRDVGVKATHAGHRSWIWRLASWAIRPPSVPRLKERTQTGQRPVSLVLRSLGVPFPDGASTRIKQYLKERRALRIETVVNAPRDLGCNAGAARRR